MTPAAHRFIRLAADIYAVDPNLVANGCKFPAVVSARHAAWLLHAEHTKNDSATAREFGVDSTSVSHARRRMQVLCDVDAKEAGLWSEAQFVAKKLNVGREARRLDLGALREALDGVERALGELKRLVGEQKGNG